MERHGELAKGSSKTKVSFNSIELVHKHELLPLTVEKVSC